MSRNLKYKLYAAAFTDENIQAAEKERFSRIVKNYVLIYKNGKKPENCVEITKDECHRLTQADKDWLFECVYTLVAEKSSERKNLSQIAGMLDKLEAALKKEKLCPKGDLTENAG